MLVLVIDTSSAAVTAGIVELAEAVEPRLLAERVLVDARAHGERLTPSIRDCLRQAGTGVGELAAVLAGVGPGPFTGLRVGLMTAAAIADAAGLPSYPVCSLDAIAAAHAEVAELLVAGDARRREIYWARYHHGRRVTGPAVGRPAEVAGELAGVQVMAGAGAELYADVLGLPVLAGRYPTVAGLAAVAADAVLAGAPSQPLTPLYLRRPDAVEPTGPPKRVTA
ncbi:MAG TPA: tRNA (adenosine(37)-N6)-threonylcarbamoyltransferase complex dimerization subunit type 1 TsaB [Jatrophihabitans sp.]|nr:tRNA (adenosine(37)-N6)-threonylcarbamoyltransferase complex dimerization subunit type 1 TsaB [Jatrophihabitans sp.]